MKKFDLKFYCSHHHDLKQKQIIIVLVPKLSKQHYIGKIQLLTRVLGKFPVIT